MTLNNFSFFDMNENVNDFIQINKKHWYARTRIDRIFLFKKKKTKRKYSGVEKKMRVVCWWSSSVVVVVVIVVVVVSCKKKLFSFFWTGTCVWNKPKREKNVWYCSIIKDERKKWWREKNKKCFVFLSLASLHTTNDGIK